MKSRIYVGRLVHARHEPVRHAFEYPVWYLALDLAELPMLDRRLRLFGLERRRPVSFRPADHLGGGREALAARALAWMDSEGESLPAGRVELVTTPRVLGLGFNPASFYRFTHEGEVTGHLVEVNNTFGSGHVYPLRADAGALERDKSFHVSPFYPVDGRYSFAFDRWDDRLDLRIDLTREGRHSFHARIIAEAQPLTDRALAGVLARYPMSVAATLPRILRHAATLYLKKGLAYHVQPEADGGRTYSSTRPAWISEFRLPRPIEKFGRWAAGSGERT